MRTCAGIVITESDGCPCWRAWRQYEALDHKSRHSLAGGSACRCGRATELRGDTSRTGPHRLLPWSKSVLSRAIGSCCRQSARAIRRRTISGHYRNRPSETQAASTTTKRQVAGMSKATCGDRYNPKPGYRFAYADYACCRAGIVLRPGPNAPWSCVVAYRDAAVNALPPPAPPAFAARTSPPAATGPAYTTFPPPPMP